MILAAGKRVARWIDDWLDDRLNGYPMTSLAFVLSFACVFGMQMIHDIMFELPSLTEIRSGRGSWDWLWMLGSWVWLGLLWFGYLVALALLVKPVPGMKVRPCRLTLWIQRQTHAVVGRAVGWPRRLGATRRPLGGVLLVVGVAVAGWLLATVANRGDVVGGIIYGCGFMTFSGLWLLTGDFTAPAGDRWARWTRTLGLALALVGISSVVGATLWWLIRFPWNPLSWRMYSLWAIVHLCGVALCLGALVDAVARDLEWRILLGAAVTAVAVFVSGVAIPVGQQRAGLVDAGSPDLGKSLTAEWFDTVAARLQTMPDTEPVIFVAAAGGGARAAMFATLVLEALERTPTHGTFGAWSEIEDGASLANQVLFLSSVSGGSVASAHFALGEPPRGAAIDQASALFREGVVPPTNTLRSQLWYHFHAEMTRLCGIQKQLCDREWTAGLRAGRECAMFGRMCDPKVEEGFDLASYSRSPDTPPWPVGSERFDDMATDFNAPLLRGFVLPGLERGQSMTRFWESRFGWDVARQRDGRAPLLLVNLTDVEAGSRMVAGFPELPPGLIGNSQGVLGSEGRSDSDTGARALSDIGAGVQVSIEEAVRMSANFPWGFDVPSLGLQPEQLPVMMIDGGVLDNTGIDTYGALLSRLELLADPLVDTVDPTLRDRSAALLRQLAKRGVVLLEIDSGAKPGRPGRLAHRLASVILPVHSLSVSAYVRASQAVDFYTAQMQEILERWAEHGYDDKWLESGTLTEGSDRPRDISLVDARLSHVVYGLDTENLMTAWALSPDQKGKLLARFISEDASQRRVLRDEFTALEGANIVSSEMLRVAPGDPGLQTFLTELSERNEGLLRWERIDSRTAKDQRKRRYDLDLATPPAARRGNRPHRLQGRSGWVLLGYYRDGEGVEADAPIASGPSACAADRDQSHEDSLRHPRWTVLNFEFCRSKRPDALVGGRFETSDPIYLDTAVPSDQGRFPATKELLRTGAKVVIEEVRQWRGTGFQFAFVRVEAATAD